VAAELALLRAENARLLKMLELSRRQAAPPGPAQAGFFDAPPGAVHQDSPKLAKRAPGYAGLGFPDPRRLTPTPSASTDS